MRPIYEYFAPNQIIISKYIIILLLSIFGAKAPLADEIDEASIKISQCLQNTNMTSDKRLKCVGLFYELCIESKNRSHLSGMVECQTIEYRAWEIQLNKIYGKIISLSDDDTESYIKKSQLSWLEYVGRKCEWPKIIYPKGTIQVPLMQECRRNETAHRTIFLTEFAERLVEMDK